jgi:hypothetical protein
MAALVATDERLFTAARSPPVDLMPLYLGARALLAGRDPNDPEALHAVFRATPGIGFAVAGFHSYYPPTASLLFLPLALLPFRVAAWIVYWGGLAALVAAAGFSASAGRSRGWMPALAAALAVGAVFLGLRVTRTVMPAGQISPFIVLAASVGLWGLSRARDRIGVAAFALGAAVKFFPLVLLPAALAGRRWRWGLAALGLGMAFAVALVLWWDGGGGPDAVWIFGARRFVLDPPVQPWARPGSFLLGLWRGRLLGLGLPTLAAVAWTAWRPTPARVVGCGGLLAAWGGLALAGGHHYHESLVILPALGFVLGWPAVRGPRLLQWAAAAVLLYALWRLQAFSRFGPPSPPHWLPLGYLTWALCGVRWGVAVSDPSTAAAPDAKDADRPAMSSGTSG